MAVIVNFPKEDEKDTFLNNLALFKAELLIKTLENISISAADKEKVFKKILEILETTKEI